jgi:hypothetical protein
VIIAFIFIPALATAFFVMPYIEIGKSRRYAHRRIGLSVTMLFIAFMLVSNWMGSPEYRVESSADQEIFQELIPQEGHSVILEVPYDELPVGEWVPGQDVDEEEYPHLALALEEFEATMNRHSCNLNGESRWKDDCQIVEPETAEGEVKYRNNFTNDAIPNATAVLIVEMEQHNMKRVTLRVEAADPDNSEEMLVSQERIAFRHEYSAYEDD